MPQACLILVFCTGSRGETALALRVDWTADFADPQAGALETAIRNAASELTAEWRFVCALRSDNADVLASAATLGAAALSTPHYHTLGPPITTPESTDPASNPTRPSS